MKRLGIDLGTSSLGWAIIDDDLMNSAPTGVAAPNPIDCGVVIFPEGMNRDKSDNLSSPAATRRMARSARRLIYRRKLRKFHMLRALMDAGMCPLSEEGLKAWKDEGRYPINEEAFMLWLQSTNESNPYADRNAAATAPVDKLVLGRALYHMAQRRGFKSSKKEQLDALESEDVTDKKAKKPSEATQTKQAIDTLTAELEKENLTLGQYFYRLFQQNVKEINAAGSGEVKTERIRGRKTGRIEHYQKEFERIAEVQGLSDELRERFASILFFQRPLRIQRHTVGYCALEKGANARKYRRCLKSHPDFEYYRALCFLNNLRIGEKVTEGKDRLQRGEGRSLTDEERQKVLTALLRKTACTVEEVLGKKKPLLDKKYYTNYRAKDDAPIMEIRSRLTDLGVSEEKWQMALNAAVDFDDLEKLLAWAQKPNTLNLSATDARTFAKIRFSTDRADYSLHAIRKIIPYLERGYTLRKATFCAKLGDIIPNFTEKQDAILQGLQDCEERYEKEKDLKKQNPRLKVHPLEGYHYKNYLATMWDVSEEAYKQLYVDVTETDESNPILPPVDLESIRNPLACRSLTVLRRLINTLRANGKIDKDTNIFIELAHTVNSANQCRAIEMYQLEQKKKHEEAVLKLQEIIQEHNLKIAINEDSILRYILWQEQDGCCVYTGQPIGVKAMLTECDIEHTIPRSRGGTNELENLTLCTSHYNRNVKKGKIPTECPNAFEEWYDPETKKSYPALELSTPIKNWKDEFQKLRKELDKKPKRGGDISAYNDARKRWLVKQMKYTYLKKKLKTFEFTAETVGREDFMPRQMVDTGIITTQAVKFLKSRYKHVFTRNGAVTAAARKAWGIQREDEKKSRIDHVHHAVDACVIAALDTKAFTDICSQLGKGETFTRWNTVVCEPYPDFAQRVNDATEGILVRHLPTNRQTKPIDKRRQRIPLSVVKRLKQAHAEPAKAQKTNSIRGSLHNDTIYGKIKLNGEEVVVLRKTIATAGADFKKWVAQGNVVDKGVCDALRAQIATYEAQGIAEKDLPNQIYKMPSGIPIKKIRIKVAKPKNPDAIRQQAFEPNAPVYGSGSDILGFNVCKDAKGKLVAEQISLLEEAKHSGEGLSSADNCFSIYPMQLAFAYEKTPDELKTLSSRELMKRLYVVRQVEEQRIIFHFHREARRTTDVISEFGQGLAQVDYNHSVPRLRVSKGVFLEHMLYEGIHFTLSMDGEVEWLND